MHLYAEPTADTAHTSATKQSIRNRRNDMGTQYRVDRTDSLVAPCGMNSIIYLGDSRQQATRALLDAELKRDAWNQPNDRYGVVLFEWYDLGKRYVPVSWRGIQAGSYSDEEIVPSHGVMRTKGKPNED